jgi:hypothetical protein
LAGKIVVSLFIGEYCVVRCIPPRGFIGAVVLGFFIVLFIISWGVSSERCGVVQGMPLYYLPKKEVSLEVGAIAADGEAVILEKRGEWILIRYAGQRGWIQILDNSTSGE